MSITIQKIQYSAQVEKFDNGSINVPTFIKWAGGKTQLLNQFKSFFPRTFNKYLEPFIGSGAVFFLIKEVYQPDEIILSDINPELINCYKVVQTQLLELLELLKDHRKNHNKEYYYSIRNLDTSILSEVELAARFIYLNKTCFNGLYRVNSKGKFNVPIGSYKNPKIFKEEILERANSMLQDVDIITMPFENVLNHANEGDFIYFDPPYHPLSSTSNFTSYTKNSFSEKDQNRLAGVYRELDKKGCQLMLSNSYSNLILELYSDYRIEKVSAKRMINCNGNGRGAIAEAVILNY
ncbi:MAG: DNA adenine methylase [ANME-2 cluster archaeon]|nr:DNA adenine methylase [ANME-2 cluster archaeon]